MRTIKLTDTEILEVNDLNTDEFGNIGLTLEQARKYINFIFSKKMKKSPAAKISKSEIDRFIDFGFNLELGTQVAALGVDENEDIILSIEEGLKYINIVFDKQENIELETNNDKGDFIFTKQEIDEFIDSAIEELKTKSKNK